MTPRINVYYSAVLMLGMLCMAHTAHARCINDTTLSLDNMATAPAALFKTIPKDFVIDEHPVTFHTNMNTIDGRAAEYRLPLESADAKFVQSYLGSPTSSFHGKAICRTKGSDQQWWLVLADKTGVLSYLRDDASVVTKSRK